jgi:hypothetical protein
MEYVIDTLTIDHSWSVHNFLTGHERIAEENFPIPKVIRLAMASICFFLSPPHLSIKWWTPLIRLD